ncbi:hypothetical protein [Neisseria dumasiana]|uniref:hypothetical protein n=1 Tax=Neisseria dumasiana TaxID=1931275 RepID=UPI0018E9AD91|nr:hypothetical protein [Neisseria dumasiana]UOO84728.1 hypothetical protein LVJ88_01560 [Neisseria dumasiana]
MKWVHYKKTAKLLKGLRPSEKACGCFSDGSGFKFEVQLSTTEKGQYAVAYGLSCKKDCI